MNKDMREIIELSNHPWIQERCPHREIRIDSRCDPRFLYFVPRHDYEFEPCYYFVTCRIHSIGTIISKEHFIWLPVGFNPESGNWQIDGLLMEALEFVQSNECILRDEFIEWLKEDKTIKSTIILKLEWLRELIGKEV